MTAIEKIEEQQKRVQRRSAAWAVGEQLKGICRADPRAAAILERDLDQKTMSITEAERQIKAYADKQRTGNFSCVTDEEAEGILRRFYGLGEKTAAEVPETGDGVIDLEAFL